MKFTLHEVIKIEGIPQRSLEGLKLFYKGSHEPRGEREAADGTWILILSRHKEWERRAADEPRPARRAAR